MTRVKSKSCELCNSQMYEGEFGESIWICSNKDCERSCADWVTKEFVESIKPMYESLQSEIDKLTAKILRELNVKVELRTVRWIGDGSGVLIIYGKKITFYFENKEVFFITDDNELLHKFREFKLNDMLFQLWDLRMRQLSLKSFS